MSSRIHFSTRFKLIAGFSVIILLMIAGLLIVVNSFNTVLTQNKQATARESVIPALTAITAYQSPVPVPELSCSG